MRLVLVVFGLMFAACTWPFPEPTARWPRPVGFGVPVWDGAVLRNTTYDAVVSGGTTYVSILQAPGRDPQLRPATSLTLQLVGIDTRTGVVRELPPSPLDVRETKLWPAHSGVIASYDTRAARFDGTSWVELPPLKTSSPQFLRGLEGGYALLRQGRQLWVLGGGVWRALSINTDPNVVSAVFGPASASEVRLVYVHGAEGLCTSKFALSDLHPTSPAQCLAGQTEQLGGEVLNGTLEDFQAWAPGLVDVRVSHFSNGVWKRGAAVRGNRLRATPEAGFAIASIDVPGSISLQNLTRVEDGRSTEALFVQSWELFGCDGELRTCARSFGFVQELVESDGAAALFVIENVVDARRSLLVKRVPLPHRDEGTCTPSCPMGQLCVRGSGIANLCVADPALAP